MVSGTYTSHVRAHERLGKHEAAQVDWLVPMHVLVRPTKGAIDSEPFRASVGLGARQVAIANRPDRQQRKLLVGFPAGCAETAEEPAVQHQ